MNLYLMRHAIASDSYGQVDDSMRSLTDKGREKLGKIAHNLNKLKIKFDVILVSPYLRTRQTAAIVAEVLDIQEKNVRLSQHLTPYGDADSLVNEIEALGDVENVLIVSHEPFLSQLIGVFVAGDVGMRVEMKKAAVCKLVVGKLTNSKCATLEWLLPPAILAEL